MSDFVAMLAVQLDSADRVSTEMFASRLKELGWTPRLPGVWTLDFEARARHSRTDTVKGHLNLACQFARLKREQARAMVHFGDEEPMAV